MRKLKIYIDTSVISNLEAPDAPELMEYSLKLWEELKAGNYNVYISSLVLTEIGRCPEVKRSLLLNFLDLIQYNELELTTEVEDLANEYISNELIPVKYADDAYHIAVATINGCSVSMKELHKIREDLYNETRQMSSAERISYLNKEADKVRVLLKSKRYVSPEKL